MTVYQHGKCFIFLKYHVYIGKYINHVYIGNHTYIGKYIIHDVKIDALQADRALNWTARINKVVDRVTQE